MTNQWGYVNPAQRVHEQRQMVDARWDSQSPVRMQQWQPVVPQVPELVQSPLAWLGSPQGPEQILQSAGLGQTRNVQADMLRGAVLGGILGWMFGRRRARSAERIAEYKRSLGI
jgi:hypothetical protein